jgi:hypothetical protein
MMHFVAFSTASGMVLGPWAALSSAAVASFTWPEFVPVGLFVRWLQPSSSKDTNRGAVLRAEQAKFLNLCLLSIHSRAGPLAFCLPNGTRMTVKVSYTWLNLRLSAAQRVTLPEAAIKRSHSPCLFQ